MDNWKITQNASPCQADSLKNPTKIDREIPYDETGSGIQLLPFDSPTLTWDAFFQSTDGCSLVSCEVKWGGCFGTI